MNRFFIISFLLTAVMFTAFTVHAQTQITAENLRDDHVQAAITALVEELYARKDPEKFWEKSIPGQVHNGSQFGGHTALSVLALLYAGETYQSERLKDAITFLEELTPGGTYVVGIRANLWAMLPPKFQANLDRDLRWLMESFSESAAGWDYTGNAYTSRKDNSIKQYGAMGLWEAAKRGLHVPNRYWQILEQSMFSLQLTDGGWNYTGPGPATGSMTSAGLTILFITQDFLHTQDAVKLGKGNKSPNQAAIDLGLLWMENNFSAETNPGKGTDFYYYLYGVERVGLASGYKFFGGHDWYREGAAAVISDLCEWNPLTKELKANKTFKGDPRAGALRTEDIAFAIMFLSRGRVPVAINKLSFNDTNWNNRPRDAANLTSWIRTNSEAGLNWQIVNMDTEPEHWLDAPLMYLASDNAPEWIPKSNTTADELVTKHLEYRIRLSSGEKLDADSHPLSHLPELMKLKRYLDLGGTIFAVAEGKSKIFAESIERAGRILYPQYKWHDLPADHPAYNLYQSVASKSIPLRGLSNGVRDLIVLSSLIDFSQHYQAANTDSEDQFNVGTNLYLYASEMNRAKPRLEPHVLNSQEMHAGGKSVKIIHATHKGNWDAEPMALEVFKAWAWNEYGLDVSIENKPLSEIGNLAKLPALVYISGTEAFEITDANKNAIKQYVESGGVILIENTGGSGTFTMNMERDLRSVFNKPIRSLLRHGIVSGESTAGAASITRIEYRPYSFSVFGAREMTPRLRGMTFQENDARVLFSREDISHGLLDQPCWGICGYTPQWSRELLANIVKYGASLR